ncbi:MAG: hypothetical protein WBH08_08100 [Methanothrix sp.]|uniref:hypothetical protein n=1 Tax=Methanothrix sp. TaxID=90426 RepID=UPI003BB6CF0F
MNEAFVSYLKSIGMEEKFIEFVGENYELINSKFIPILKEEIFDIFIEETVSDDRKRKYENIDFITTNFIIEVRMFSREIAIFPVKKVRYLNIKRTEYHFETATSESKMNINFISSEEMDVGLSASGTNCAKLKEIMDKYIIPKMIA